MYSLLFDIDGTLIHTQGAGRAALSSGFEQAFGVRDEKEIETSGRTDRSIVRDLFAAHGVAESAENWKRLAAAYAEHLPAHLTQREGCVLPGVTTLLAHLGRRDDALVGLLTGNSEVGARLKLEHFGIWEQFGFGAFGDAHHDRNDVAADALAHVHQQCNGKISGDRIFVIGDTPHDIRCARHIGARAIAVMTGWNTREEIEAAEPDELLDDLSDLDAVLAMLKISK